MVIDRLKQQGREGNAGLAYVYYVHFISYQTASIFFESSLLQLVMQSVAMLDDLK